MKEKREKKNINKNTLWRKTGSWPSVAGVYNCRIEGKTDWFFANNFNLSDDFSEFENNKKKTQKGKTISLSCD